MESHALRSLFATTHTGNVTRAAHHLHIIQPALSRQLSELEREVGCDLLVREPRGVTLTEQGTLLRKRADEIVSLADRTERELHPPTAEVEGGMWVGGGESRAMELIARVATAIVVEHPGVMLRVHSGNGIDVMERIDRGLLDFGVVFGPEPNDRHQSLKLPHEDRWRVLMRRHHPLAAREKVSLDGLRGRRIITSSEGGTRAEDTTPWQSILLRKALMLRQPIRCCTTPRFWWNPVWVSPFALTISWPQAKARPFTYVPLSNAPTTPAYLVWRRFVPLSRACELFLRGMRDPLGTSE